MNSSDLAPLILSRRKSLSILGSLAVAGLNPVSVCGIGSDVDIASGNGYDLNNPVDKLQLFEKLSGDLSGKKVFSLSKGRVFGIRPDLKSDLQGFGKEVLRFTGCSMRIKRILANGNVETKSRSWLLYQHPITKESVSYTHLTLPTTPYV